LIRDRVSTPGKILKQMREIARIKVGLMMKVISIVGTRPEIIKMSPLIPLLDASYDNSFVHTGQHYDYSMSKVFFKELGLREPDYNLNIRSNSPPKQIGAMLIKLDKIIRKIKPNFIIVLGDTNSPLAGALAASKHHIPTVHVEAGLRSFDKTMPEEINRITIDHISNVLFAPSRLAVQHLSQEGVTERVFLVGNTIVDVCLKCLPDATKLNVHVELGLTADDYVVVTLHREANTEEDQLRSVAQALVSMPSINFVFPIHPRTQKRLMELNFLSRLSKSKNIQLINPLGYLEFLCLMQHSRFILTDSGGIQEEAITLKVPCLTLRENTERWETVDLGVNKLIGVRAERIIEETEMAWRDDEWKRGVRYVKNPYGAGLAAEKIIKKLEEVFRSR